MPASLIDSINSSKDSLDNPACCDNTCNTKSISCTRAATLIPVEINSRNLFINPVRMRSAKCPRNVPSATDLVNNASNDCARTLELPEVSAKP